MMANGGLWTTHRSKITMIRCRDARGAVLAPSVLLHCYSLYYFYYYVTHYYISLTLHYGVLADADV